MGLFDRWTERAVERALANPESKVGALIKARTEEPKRNMEMPTAPVRDRRAVQFYPFGFLGSLGRYKERVSPLTFGTLRAMSYRTPVISAIINTRVAQVSAFSKPQRDRFSLGHVVRLREVRRSPRPHEEKEMQRLSRFLSTCGTITSHKDLLEGTSLCDFLKMMARDSLTFDQNCFEVIPDRMGRPARIVPVDAATIRLAGPLKTNNGDPVANYDPSIQYVQIVDNVVKAEFKLGELSVGIRNPRTDILSNGYGFSELEMLINIVTAMLWAEEYNRAFFSKGSAPKGMLLFEGAVNEEQFDAFKRQWYAQIAGVENAWRTPIINAEKLQYVDMQKTNREMEYRAYIDFLVKVGCAVFLIDPAEINFQGNQGGGGSQQVTFESKQEQRIKYSRDRGLRPLLEHLEAQINRHVIWALNDDFEFSFEGLNTLTREEMADRLKGEVTTYKTIDEVREEMDMKPLPDNEGKLILNQIYVMNKQQMAMEAQGQGGEQGLAGVPGMPTGAEGAPGGAPAGAPAPQGGEQLPAQPGMEGAPQTIFDAEPEQIQELARSIRDISMRKAVEIEVS